jgi:uncharacterized repeat protein (TIGR02543 family)
MRYLYTYLIISFITGPLWSATCPAGRAHIYFGNGVNTDPVSAITNAKRLEDAIRSELAASASVDLNCLDFGLSYDSRFLDSTHTLVNWFNIALQVAVSSGLQVNAQFAAQLWSWFADVYSAPTWFQQVISSTLQSSTTVFQPDLQSHIRNYGDDLRNREKVIIVAHSQGNLYANQAYAALVAPQASDFSLISVATPADVVAGNGLYVTLTNDIINLVLGSLPGNTTNNPAPGAPCSSAINLRTRLACHAFDTSYLAGDTSRSKIVNDVVLALPIVIEVSKTGSGKGRIVSSPRGIDCDSTCISMQAGFRTYEQVSLTAVADNGWQFKGWSGDCATLAVGGVTDQSTIQFSAYYDATRTVIRSYPESCIATFGSQSSLSLAKAGAGTGTVTSLPSGINCGSGCSTQTAPFSGPVQLTAIAASGSTFTGWSGGCTGTSVTVTVNVSGNQTCTATFMSSNTNSLSLDVSCIPDLSTSEISVYKLSAKGTVAGPENGWLSIFWSDSGSGAVTSGFFFPETCGSWLLSYNYCLNSTGAFNMTTWSGSRSMHGPASGNQKSGITVYPYSVEVAAMNSSGDRVTKTAVCRANQETFPFPSPALP